ncbi:dihydrodipicolinate synthase family protein [Streptomyces malaysiensis]|uniref:dihydrodipicolinate synthase family protein n=1 Tax=Streptomyces malaysiensis TaxID=92644 RepID=UPI003720F90D
MTDAQHSSIPVWGMVLTPFTPTGAVDHVSLARHVSALVADGVQGLIALGVIAEPIALTRAERGQVLDTVLEHAQGRPVVATVMSLDHDDRRLDLRDVVAPRRDHLQAVMVPVSSSHADVLVRDLKDTYQNTTLPLWLQDYPMPTGIHIGLSDLLRVLAAVPEVAAVKCEAPPTFWRIHKLAAAQSNLTLLSGMGGANLVEDLVAGARVVACGISRPRVLVDAAAAWDVGDLASTRAHLGRIAGLIGLETQPGTSVAVRKEHWRRRGIISSATVRPPQLPYPEFLSALSTELGYSNDH